jgi:hypothetical protein
VLLETLQPAEVGHHVDDRFLLVEPALFWQIAETVRVVGIERGAVDQQSAGGRAVDAEQSP